MQPCIRETKQMTTTKTPVAHLIQALFATFIIATSPLAAAQQEAKLPSEASIPYTIKPGDKLMVLGPRILTTPADWPELGRVNGLKSPYPLVVGKTLHIPLRMIGSTPANGKVVSVSGDVQMGGSPSAVGSTLTEGDKFKTGPNSSAVLELADGSRVTLMPNTLAELTTSRSYATRDAAASGSSTWFSGIVRLVQGGVDTVAAKSVRRATPLQIQTPTSTVGVRGTQFRVAFADPLTQNARAEVLEGLVKADNTAQRSSADLPQGKGALLDPTVKDIKVVDLLKAPDLSATPSGLTMSLGQWPMPVLQGASSFRVQVASDEGFNKIVRDLVVPGTAGATGDLSAVPNGNWFARIRGIDGSGIEGYDSVKVVKVFQPPRRWTVSQNRLESAAGRQLLQLSPAGLDNSHTIVARVTEGQAPNQRVAEVTANGSRPQISIDLGLLAPGVPLELQLTVTQADGEVVLPLTFRFTTLGSWERKDGALQPVVSDKP
jgi:hypothetical protein